MKGNHSVRLLRSRPLHFPSPTVEVGEDLHVAAGTRSRIKVRVHDARERLAARAMVKLPSARSKQGRSQFPAHEPRVVTSAITGSGNGPDKSNTRRLTGPGTGERRSHH